MRSYVLFQEYIWLVNIIHRTRKISFEEINRKWLETEMSEGVSMARSTFNRHKDAIQDMFGIYIECDKKDGFKYYIGNVEVLEADTIQNWMLSTLSVNNILSESRAVYDRILLEMIPSDGDALHCFIDAMKRSVRIHVRYRRYGVDTESEMILDPYCVKLFSRRWYALVKFPDAKGLFTLAFDRILLLEATEEKFEFNRHFIPVQHFQECYGIVHDEKVPLERIVIRAIGRESFYMRDLPLHHTQKEIFSNEEYTDFELFLRPTPDFFSPLLARGAAIKVMKPQWIADELKRLHQEAVELYKSS